MTGMLYQSPPMICRRQARAMHAMLDWLHESGYQMRFAYLFSAQAIITRDGEILVRRDDAPAEQIFSLAHEIAHLLIGPHFEEESAEAKEQQCDDLAREILLAVS